MPYMKLKKLRRDLARRKDYVILIVKLYSVTLRLFTIMYITLKTVNYLVKYWFRDDKESDISPQ